MTARHTLSCRTPLRVFVKGLVLLVLCIVLDGCSLDSFLYNAQPLDAYVLSDSVIPAANREEVVFTSEGHKLYGFFIRQPDSLRVEPHHTILYNHGNKDHIAYYWQRVEYLYRAGFDVFVYDYRGFGRSEGESSAAGLAADAKAAWQYVTSRPDVDTTRIVPYGFSLGGTAALALASGSTTPHALILEATFASTQTLVQSGTVLDIPESYVLNDAINNVESIRNISCPVLILHGDADAFIDMKNNGQVLFDAAHNPKTFIGVVGAGHEGVPEGLGIQLYIDRIMVFIRGN